MTAVKRIRGPRALRDVLAEVFTTRGLAAVHSDDQWQEIWGELVGTSIAEHTRVIGIRKGELEVIVDNSVLLQELSMFRSRALLEQVQRRMPKVRLKKIRFRVGPVE